jgi:hypothetical protein
MEVVAPGANPFLTEEALEKRRQREKRRAEQKDDWEADPWDNTYGFNGFSVKVLQEFGGDSCVGGVQWPGGSNAHGGRRLQVLGPYLTHALRPCPLTVYAGGARIAAFLDNRSVFPEVSTLSRLVPSPFPPSTSIVRWQGALEGRTVLELGAGCGLPSVVAAKLGAR